ncbi:hypothetical protein ACN42_g9878 [Penicillium freii]|uniref:Uncharacterized protein n=1 Tax=Penicillium freii TaxID=48697 RepID=A0A101MBC3_PENFR|nr:hypothetical protein ACN42_g9878 [Penicillium freii]
MNWHPAQDLGSLIIGLDADTDFFPYLSRMLYSLQRERGQLPTRIVVVDQSVETQRVGNVTPSIKPGPSEEAAMASTDTNRVPLVSSHV